MTNRTKNKTPLDLALERRREQGNETKSNMLKILGPAKQPLTAREVAYLYAEKFGRKFDSTYVHHVLTKLAEDGLVQSREERFDEALIRNDGQSIRGSHSSTYYFTPGKRHIARTAVSIDGVIPTGVNKSKKVKKAKKKTQARVVTSKVQTGSLESMLRQRAVELESELEAIYRLIKK